MGWTKLPKFWNGGRWDWTTVPSIDNPARPLLPTALVLSTVCIRQVLCILNAKLIPVLKTNLLLYKNLTLYLCFIIFIYLVHLYLCTNHFHVIKVYPTVSLTWQPIRMLQFISDRNRLEIWSIQPCHNYISCYYPDTFHWQMFTCTGEWTTNQTERNWPGIKLSENKSIILLPSV